MQKTIIPVNKGIGPSFLDTPGELEQLVRDVYVAPGSDFWKVCIGPFCCSFFYGEDGYQLDGRMSYACSKAEEE